jgi:cysteinyl-tRNA synthetase
MKFERINDMIRNIVFTSADNYENEKHDRAYDIGHNAKDPDTIKKFKTYIEDDLNTPKALKLFLDTVKHPEKINDAKKMMEIFGLRY